MKIIEFWDEAKRFFNGLIKHKVDPVELTELQRVMWMSLKKGE